MQFLAVSQNTGDPRPFIEAEGAKTAELTEAGVFEHAYLKADWSGAVIILNAPSQHEAQSAVDSLPLVTHGITSFALTPIIDPATVTQ